MTAIRTPDQRLRVFISSTMRELAEERAAARDAVSSLRLTPVLFELGARPHPPRDLYRAYLEQSHIFIGIYAREYGWVAPDMEVSGIEDEYEQCGGQPRLVYVKESPERDPRLRALLDRISGEGGLSYKHFRTAEELRELIVEDLALVVTERFLSSPERAADRSAGLPAFATRLIGREGDVASIAQMLAQDDIRLVTLTGPGGIGKTRLAVAAAAAARRFADGVCFADLQDVRHPARVAAVLAAELGVKESGSTAAEEALEIALRDAEQLIIVDNFEQVIDAAPLLARMLARCPRIKLLVTSREALRINGEHEYPVAPLALPGEDDSYAVFSERDAVRLFVERAQAVRPGFVLGTRDIGAVSEIVRRLDGLPLAIELAAMRARALTPQAICERLSDRLATAAGSARDLPERQRTMRAAIAWSYELLNEDEQRLFARLGVFFDGFMASSAEAVVADEGEEGQVIDIIDSLVGKSLVRAGLSDAGEPRFRMLELIREFALEMLAARGEMEAMRERHARHFAAEAASWRDPFVSAGAPAKISYVNDEYANFREALVWTAEHAEQAGAAMFDTLLPTLYLYWYLSGRLSEGRELAQRALEAAERAGMAQARAAALYALGAVNMWQGRLTEARTQTETAVAMYRELGIEARLPYALLMLGVTTLHQGDIDASEAALREAIALFRSTGQITSTGICFMHLGNIASQRGETEQARAHLEEGLRIERENGPGWSTAWFLSNIGELLRISDEHEQARGYYDDALPLLRSVGVVGDLTRTKYALAYVSLRLGDIEAARRMFEETLEEYGRAGNRRGVAESLQGLASIAAARGDDARSARLFGAADRALADAGAGAWPADAHERGRDLAVLAGRLPPDDLERELAAGRAMTVDEATALARSGGVSA